jgi:NAD dependent epimerase/dehydratase family enzyme
VNGTAPNPARFAALIAEAGRVAHRPTVLPVPKFALSLVMGKELTEEVILAGQRVLPAAAEASGFAFTHPELRTALEAVLAR